MCACVIVLISSWTHPSSANVNAHSHSQEIEKKLQRYGTISFLDSMSRLTLCLFIDKMNQHSKLKLNKCLVDFKKKIERECSEFGEFK